MTRTPLSTCRGRRHIVVASRTACYQWRRQLVGTWARAPPLAFENFFCYTFKQVWFGLVLCQTLNLALFVQPYSLWNDTITEYNGACAKVNVVFTARRYALARSLLSSGVRPSVCVHHVRALYPDGCRYRQTSFLAAPSF